MLYRHPAGAIVAVMAVPHEKEASAFLALAPEETVDSWNWVDDKRRHPVALLIKTDMEMLERLAAIFQEKMLYRE